ncbi:TPA: hypothetical protein JI054_08065 [Acinetobacter baumannii]|jgi:hypothetical protein|uniref:Lipoprotein n=5 Tax=Acinetobacter TaxID=469 RepID=A0A242U7J9_ACIPI|nr:MULTISPECIES: hypothetical protein [Acinetobacter]HBY5034619.1 hypothetical protein [Klebsiella pneumoniae]AGQ08121.1 hypothetical protein BJAB0715_03475 [Acinetobacter baumannii BJAB0715]AHB90086.1 hypothetical protein P795_1805 [Acinetobacter baumannii ZW85-1]AIY35738.1 hypothetical protein ABLAC_03830 [Acinetobacter baumannii LAC-4]AKQ29203.1 hypothetical protein ACX61_01930 [Acinetobacter baumannii]
MKNLNLLLISTLLFTGCATTKSIQYPAAGKQTSLSVSSEQLSSMTESGAGDYFIKDSQILVGDSSNASASPVSGMFGLIGVGVAMAIDKNANSSAIEKSSLNQPIKFDQLIHQKITDSLTQNKADPTIKLLDLNQASEVKIVPYSRLSFREKPIVKVNFGLKTQFKNAADNNADTKRLYHYVSKDRISLAEWEAQNNLLFMKKADQAFSALSQVFTLDLQHQLNLKAFDESKQKNCKTNADTSLVSFIQTPDNLCVGVVKTNKGDVFENSIYIVEQ